MDKDTILRYAPIILVVAMVFTQYQVFSTPKDIEVLRREVMSDVASMYATKEKVDILQTQLNNLNDKLDKVIYILTKDK